jgi:hypothetical protein
VADTLALAKVLEHTINGGGRIRRLTESGEIQTGHLRYLCGPELGAPPADIRDAHVRVTTESGFEIAVPLVVLARQARAGECVLERAR